MDNIDIYGQYATQRFWRTVNWNVLPMLCSPVLDTWFYCMVKSWKQQRFRNDSERTLKSLATWHNLGFAGEHDKRRHPWCEDHWQHPADLPRCARDSAVVKEVERLKRQTRLNIQCDQCDPTSGSFGWNLHLREILWISMIFYDILSHCVSFCVNSVNSEDGHGADLARIIPSHERITSRELVSKVVGTFTTIQVLFLRHLTYLELQRFIEIDIFDVEKWRSCRFHLIILDCMLASDCFWLPSNFGASPQAWVGYQECDLCLLIIDVAAQFGMVMQPYQWCSIPVFTGETNM